MMVRATVVTGIPSTTVPSTAGSRPLRWATIPRSWHRRASDRVNLDSACARRQTVKGGGRPVRNHGALARPKAGSHEGLPPAGSSPGQPVDGGMEALPLSRREAFPYDPPGCPEMQGLFPGEDT